MPRARDYIPKLCVHKRSGRAYVKIDGRQHYCGRAGTPASRREYDRIVRDWLGTGRSPLAREPDAGPTVADLAAWYAKTELSRYRSPDKARSALQDLVASWGDTPARSFGPKALKALRASWAARGLCRETANRYAVEVRRLFRWAVAEELLPSSCHEALRALPGLRIDEAGAKDRPPVRPAPEAHVAAVLPLLSGPLQNLARLMRLTGMRPGEAVILRPRDVDRSGEVWTYRPRHHKTAHLGRRREVAIGPRAQAILGPHLDGDPDTPAFRVPGRPNGYTARSFSIAVRRACDRAGVPRWHPNQLRHSAATDFRRRFGLDAAQVALGHATADVTQVYAEADLDLARRVALELG
jgi:integrase